MSETDIFIGFGLTILLAVGCQIVSNRVGLPAIILLLPAGFVAGHYLSEMNLEKTFGSAFSPWWGWRWPSFFSTAGLT